MKYFTSGLIAGMAIILLFAIPGILQAQHDTDQLSVARYHMASASSGNKIFFAGGQTVSIYFDVVDIYDVESDTWETAKLSVPRSRLAAAAAGNLVMFAGGYNEGVAQNVVDIYNTDTGEWTTDTLSSPRSELTGVSVGNKIMFAGGGGSDVVDIYDLDTGTWSQDTLSQARSGLVSASNGTIAAFAGGQAPGGIKSDRVDFYHSETGEWTTSTLSSGRNELAAAASGDIFIFAGGQATTEVSTADIYDASTESWSTGSLTSPTRLLAGTSLNHLIVFAGGRGGENNLDAYNTQTEEWHTGSLEEGRYWLTAASAGSKMVFAGGFVSNAVDIFNTAIPVPASLTPTDGSAATPPLIMEWEAEPDTAFQFLFHLSPDADYSGTLLSGIPEEGNRIELSDQDGLVFDSTYHWRVQREHTEQDWLRSDWEERSFQLVKPDVADVPVPALLTPAHQEAVELPESLTWEEISEEGYHFEIHVSGTPDFSDTLLFGAVDNDSLLLSQEDFNEVGESYYWRVRSQVTGFEDVVSEWTDREFSLTVDTPVISAPIAGATVEPPVDLVWDSTGAGYDFDFHLSSQPDFSDTLRYDSLLTDHSLTLTQADSLRSGNSYYWRVKRSATVLDSLESEWSESSFDVQVDRPTLISPARGAEVEPPITLTWAQNDSTDYRFNVHLSSTSDFTDTLRYEPEWTDSTLVLDQADSLNIGETYFWQVRRQGVTDDSLLSEWISREFTVAVLPPVISAESDGTKLEPPVTLSWDGGAGDWLFDVHLSSQPDFSDTLRLETDISEHSIVLDRSDSLVLNQTYYYRVDKEGADDPTLFSDWAESSFTFEIAPPVMAGPAEGEMLDNPVTLEWEAEPKQSYQTVLQVSGDSTFSSLSREEIYEPANHQVSLQLSPESNQTHYWRLRREHVFVDPEDPLMEEQVLPSDWVSSSFFVNPDYFQLVVDHDSSRYRQPSYVDVSFNVLDQNNRGVTNLGKEDFELLEDNIPVSGSESSFQVTNRDNLPYEMKTVMMLDNSQSIGEENLEFIKDAAREFIRNKVPNQEISIWVFADLIEQRMDFSSNTDSLLNIVDQITLTTIPGTDLYSAAIEGLNQWENEFSLTSITQGFLMLFTDGKDEANNKTLNDVLVARGNKQVFAVGVDQGQGDFDEQALREIGNAGIFIETEFSAELINRFREVQERLDSFSRSFYWINYSSPKRNGIHTLTVRVKGNTNFGSNRELDMEFDATGFRGVPSEIVINGTAEKPTGVEELTMAADDTLQVKIESPFTFEVQPFQFSISEPAKLSIKPVEGEKYQYLLLGNGIEGDTLEVVIRDTALTTLDLSKTLEVIYTEPNAPPVQPDVVTLAGPADETGDLSLTPKLEWNRAANANLYQVQLSTSSDFTATAIDSVVSDTAMVTEELLELTQYFWRVRGLNRGLESDWSEVWSFNTTQIIDPTVVTLLSPADATETTDPDMEFVWGEVGFLHDDYQIQVATTDAFEVLHEDSTVTDTVLTLQGFDDGTYHWRVRARTGPEFSDWSRVRSFTITSEPVELTVQISRTFGSAAGPQDYRLVALPGNAEVALADVLSGTAGVEWQAYWDNGADSDYLVRYDGSSAFGLAPGNGFWVTSKSAMEYSATIPAVTLDSEDRTVIPLHTGWNIISNPTDLDISWADVATANSADLQPVWSFDGAFSESDAILSAGDGEAFYFLNDSGLEELILPYQEAAEKGKSAEPLPELRILTLADSIETSSSRIVFADSEDQRPDAVAPPGGFEGAALRFAGETEGEAPARAGSFASLYREYQPEGQRFRMTLNATPGEPVTFSADDGNGSVSGEVVLVDEETGTLYDITSDEGAEFTPSTETTHFQLMIGSLEYIEQERSKFLPAAFEIRTNYPNPFESTTTLEFSLPEQAEVRLVVYDILGRKVVTLLDETRQAGVHPILFDASGLASGVYLAVFDLGDRRFTEKMTLIK